MLTAIQNGRLLLPPGLTRGGVLLLRDGCIEGVVDQPPQGAQVLDAQGLYVSPGFVDLHVHGGAGADFMDGTPDAFRTAARHSLRGGATTIYPTTLCASPAALHQAMDAFAAVQGQPDLPRMPGLHLEGPFLAAAQAGAQDVRALALPSPANVEPLLERHALIARMSVACELPGALALGDRLAALGIVAAIGHSDACYPEVLAAVAHGYTHVTHLYSGMSTLRRERAHRVLGVLESAYLLDELSVEIIADGQHLPPELLRLICKSKPMSAISLVTDALRGAGLPQGSRIRLGEGDRYALVENGVAYLPDHSCFAGSVATAAQCVHTLWRQAGVPLPEAVAMMTRNPCRVMGTDARRGSLQAGMDADLVFFDEDVTVHRVLVGGETRYARGEGEAAM